MEKMNDLRDLLRVELQDLFSVEEQIIEALPKMIEKASNGELKAALKEHLLVTQQQKSRLEQLQQKMGAAGQSQEEQGLFGRLFKSRFVCEGMQGIIKEANKMLGQNMNPDVLDAAIIACAQKVEHYEICGYGTARSYAEELGLDDVAATLQQTLDEEYNADDRLTALAEGRLNRKAQQAGSNGSSRTRSKGGSSEPASPRSGSKMRETAPEAQLEMASASKTGGRKSSPSSSSDSSSTSGRSGTGSGASKKGSALPASGTASPAASGKSSAGRNAASAGSTGRSASGSTGRSISGSGSAGTTRAASGGNAAASKTPATRGSGGASGNAGSSGSTGRGSSRGAGGAAKTR